MTEWLDIRTLAAVGDGNPISSWAGVKGLLTMSATLTQRPTYFANDGDGRPSAVLDGADDTWNSNAVSGMDIFGSTGSCETWAVVRCPAGNRGFFSTTSGSGMGCYLFTANVFLDSPGSANRINSATGINNNAWRVLRLAKTGARRVIQAEGTTLYDASTTSGTWSTALTTLKLGDIAAVKFAGGIRHFLTFNSFLSNADAAALNSYLMTFI